MITELEHISTIQPDPDLFHGYQIGGIANLPEELKQLVCIRCQHCGKWIHEAVPLYMAPHIACNDCADKWEKKNKWDRIAKYWERLVPPALRETDLEHADFPKAIYTAHQSESGNRSMFLYGPTGSCKTRMAVMFIRKALINGLHPGILWPADLKHHARSWQDRRQTIEALGKHDVLLMDDALLTGAQDERIADFLKDLIDHMQRHKRHMIITSQIGKTEYEEQADKFKNLTKADKERIEALLRRISDDFTVIPFITPKADEPSF